MSAIEGRTVVITCAEGVLADGATVLGVDKRADRLEALASKGALTLAADVADKSAMAALVEKAVSDTDRIDVLFNNAGMGSPKRVEDLGDGEFEHFMTVHVYGALYAMRAAVPHMRRQNYGRIVSTISRGAEATRGAAYNAAKAALWSLSRCLAEEVADDNILVNSLIPGPTNTAIFGRDMPHLQPPEKVYPTVRMMATFDEDGPRGKVFFWEKEYPMFLGTIPKRATLDYWKAYAKREGLY